jgi:hypothetical protein
VPLKECVRIVCGYWVQRDKEREPKRTRRIDWLRALGAEGLFQMPKSTQLPRRLPPGSKYIVESHGRKNGCTLMNRYLELPDGRRVDLAPRLVPIGRTAASKTGRCTGRGAARH